MQTQPGAATLDEPHAKSAETVLTAYISEQCEAVQLGDALLRRGLDPIHPTRVATRRLRSTLRTFASLCEPNAAQTLDGELSWYAGLLGSVRQRQVLRERFADMLRDMPTGQLVSPAGDRMDQLLADEQSAHLEQLMRELETSRYHDLLSALSIWASNAPFSARAAGDANLLRSHVKAAGRRAARRLATAVGPRGDTEALHGARKAAKRARYAAELAEPVLGETAARRMIDRQKVVQEALGEHQDSVDALAFLQRFGSQTPGADGSAEVTRAYLYAREREASRRALEKAAALAARTRGSAIGLEDGRDLR